MSQFNQHDAVHCTSTDHRHTKPASARATLIPVPQKQIRSLQIKAKSVSKFYFEIIQTGSPLY